MSYIDSRGKRVPINNNNSTDVGPTGPVGPDGAPGITGPQGHAGQPGLPGLQGPPGQDGLPGLQGPPGQPGLPGLQGPPGQDGLPGLQGPPGQDGLQGAQGEAGNIGLPGLQGPPGELGPTGQKGDCVPGPTGTCGPQGPTGMQGPQGPIALVSSAQLVTYKTAQFVPVDTDVNLGNINVRLSSKPHNLMMSTVSGAYSVYGSCSYITYGQGWSEIKSSAAKVIKTESSLLVNYPDFTSGGDSCSWLLTDSNAGIAWRIYLIVGDNYNNNFISIEQLS